MHPQIWRSLLGNRLFGEKNHLLQYFFFIVENTIHTYNVFHQIHPSSPLQLLPTHYFSLQTTCALFSPLRLLSAACVCTGEGPWSRSKGRFLGARMLEDPPSASSPQQKNYKWQRNMVIRVILLVCCLSFLSFFLMVNILNRCGCWKRGTPISIDKSAN